MNSPTITALDVVKRRWRLGAVPLLAVGTVATLGTGSAVAAGYITSADIVNQTIQSRDIGADEVGASELRSAGDGAPAVRKEHIADHAVGWRELNPYAQARASALNGYQVVTGKPITVAAGQVINVTLDCPESEIAIGGGYLTSDGIRIMDSAPTEFGDGWVLQAKNTTDQKQDITPRATCAGGGD